MRSLRYARGRHGEVGGEHRGRHENRAFAVEQPVVHEAFGNGVVMSADDDRVTVLFEDAGYRELDARLVEAENLLRPV